MTARFSDVLVDLFVGKRTGFLPFPAPTGSGKSYECRRALCRLLQDGLLAGRRAWVVSAVRNNLFVDELMETLGGELADKVLYARPFLERFEDYADDEETVRAFRKTLQRDECLRRFLPHFDMAVADVRFARARRGQADAQVAACARRRAADSEKRFRSSVLDAVRCAWRRVWRSLPSDARGGGIEAYLAACYAWVDRHYPWMFEIWPELAWRRHTILLMSVDRFMLPIGGFERRRYYEAVAERDMVIVDELESAKATMLDRLTGRRDAEDDESLVDVRSVCAHLARVTDPESGNVPDGMRTLSQTGRDYIGEAHASVSAVEKRFARHYLVREDERIAPATFSLFGGVDAEDSWRAYGQGRARLRFCGRSGRWVLSAREGEETVSLSRFVNALAASSAYTAGAIALSAYKYARVQGGDYRDILRAVIDNKRCHETSEAVIRHIERLTENSPWSRTPSLDQHKYERPHYLIRMRFPDPPPDDHTRDSVIHFLWAPCYPEALFKSLANRALVVGLSATAEVPSVTHCLDLAYLQDVRIADARVANVLRAMQRRARARFQGVGIHVEWVDDDVSGAAGLREAMKSLAGDGPLDRSRLRAIDAVCNAPGIQEADGFHIARLWRLTRYMANFQLRGIESMLAFFPMLPGDSTLISDDLLRALYDFVRPMGDEFEWLVVRAGDARTRMDRCRSVLKAGGRVFLLTSYASFGVGQNPDYEGPDGTRHDFQAIALDRMTHVLTLADMRSGKPVPLSPSDQLATYMKLGYLLHRGEIDLPVYRKLIACLLRGRYQGVSARDLVQIESVGMGVVAGLVQAIGRLNRCAHKHADVFVFADGALSAWVARLSPYGPEALGNPMVFKLVADARRRERGRKVSMRVREEDPVCVAAVNRDRQIRWHIHRRFRSRDWDAPWLAHEIQQIEAVREEALKAPVRDGVSAPAYYADFGRPVSRYFYVLRKTGGREETTGIALDPACLSPSSDEIGPFEVSEAASRLPMLMRSPPIRAYFERKGYATTWGEGRFSLLPSVYQAHYLGALGEAAGIGFFENALDWKTAPLPPRVWERFDSLLTLENGTSILIDWKLWRESGSLTLDTAEIALKLEKIVEQAPGVSPVAVWIVGALSENFSVGEYTVLVHGREVPVKTLSGLIAPTGIAHHRVIERLHRWRAEASMLSI